MPELFDQLCEGSKLKAAWQRVLRKGSAGGVDGVQVQDLEKDIEKTLEHLVAELKSNRYVPVPYAKAAIPKLNEANEWRKLSMPAVVDKVVQHAFRDIVEPIFEKTFLDCSYAYRAGKGPGRAIRRLEHILRTNRILWVSTLDIDNFFDTLDHNLLIEQFKRKVAEKEMLNLATLWITAGIIGSRGEYDEPGEGIAQGSVISPLFSNIYLHPLDALAVENGYHYIRYSDNFILLSENKDNLYVAYEKLRAFLENELRLRLNENPHPFKPVSGGFAFLGIYFKEDTRRISTAKETKIFRRLNWLTDKAHNPDPQATLKKLNQSIEQSVRYYGPIHPVQQFQAFDEHLLKRLRFLLGHFHQTGVLPSKDDVKAFIKQVKFFVERDQASHESLCLGLSQDVFGAQEGKKGEPEEKEKDGGAASRAKRATAQKNRFLRKIADRAEIIAATPGLFIGKTGGRVVMREQRRNVLEVPFSKISNLAINANGVTLSSDLVFQCAQSKIPITFYSYKGMPYAVLQTPLHSMGAVSIQQLKACETDIALVLAKAILTGKGKNQMNLLKFYLRSRKDGPSGFKDLVDENLRRMQNYLVEIKTIALDGAFCIARDRLFSAEGRISACYWECMKKILSPELGFEKRDRHKAGDLVNCLLNYGYGILYQRVWQAVIRAGLNPNISFLHAFQSDKPTLTYDLVEEFRQPFVDRPVFSLLTRGNKGADLKLEPETGLLSKETKTQVINAVLNRLASVIEFRRRKIRSEDVIALQIRNVVDYLERKKTYKPFVSGY